jgi:hypothetical protein
MRRPVLVEGECSSVSNPEESSATKQFSKKNDAGSGAKDRKLVSPH